MEPGQRSEVMLNERRESELPKSQRDAVGQPFRDYISSTLCFLDVLRVISGLMDKETRNA